MRLLATSSSQSSYTKFESTRAPGSAAWRGGVEARLLPAALYGEFELRPMSAAESAYGVFWEGGRGGRLLLLLLPAVAVRPSCLASAVCDRRSST